MKITETELEVLKALVAQQKKGRQRYGVGLSFKQSKDPVHWVNEAIEEAVDMLQYLVAMKLTLTKGAKKCK